MSPAGVDSENEDLSGILVYFHSYYIREDVTHPWAEEVPATPDRLTTLRARCEVFGGPDLTIYYQPFVYLGVRWFNHGTVSCISYTSFFHNDL